MAQGEAPSTIACPDPSHFASRVTFRAVVASSHGVQNAGTEQVESRTAIHRALEELDAVYMAFGGPGGPWKGEGGAHLAHGQAGEVELEAGDGDAGRAAQQGLPVLEPIRLDRRGSLPEELVCLRDSLVRRFLGEVARGDAGPAFDDSPLRPVVRTPLSPRPSLRVCRVSL